MSFVTHLVKSLTVLMISADHLLTLMSVHVTLIVSRTVVVLIIS